MTHIQKPDGVDRYVGAISIAQAIESFTKRTDLSPVARLLGIELVSRFNARTLECFPTGEYLSRALGVSNRTISSAKAELKRAGLIDWRGGYRGLACNYVISWRRLRESLEQFRDEYEFETGVDYAGLVTLHNEIQSDNGGSTVLPLDGKVEADCINGGSRLQERWKQASTLLSHYKSHESTQQTRARGDDVETSPLTLEREPLPHSEPIGPKSTEEDGDSQNPSILKHASSGLTTQLPASWAIKTQPHHDPDEARREARRELLHFMGSCVRDKTPPDLLEQGIDIAITDGKDAALGFMSQERSKLRARCSA